MVFDVAGTIFLNSPLRIVNDSITIAGQTAPGQGVCIARHPVNVAADNVILRYLRFRVGNESGGEPDGLGGCDHRNIIVDHCTVSWSVDETCSIYGNTDATVQWCLISESLRTAGHKKGRHGYGAIVGGRRMSFHHNLLAHHESRFPRLGPRAGTQADELVDMRCNVFYNWAGNGCYGGEGMRVNIVNNYYKPGPATPQGKAIARRIFAPGIRTTRYCRDENGRPNSWAPMEHVWGKFYGQWFAGAAVFVFDHEKFTADKLLRKIEQYHITSFCAPPTVYRFMIREDFSKYDLSSLRYCCTAGEALNPAVYNRFYELTGRKMKEGFGQTETTMTLGTMPWTEPKPGSMGLPNPQYDIDLLRPDGTPCEDGEKGQIVVRVGKDKPIGLFKGYYRDEELTRRVWHDGIYYTGDMAWRDEDGYYWFVGRIDDVIKSSGYRIGPFEVESALMTHPAVVECAITGVPDDIRGMVVKATIVLGKEWKDKAGDDLVKELQNHVKHETAPYKYPRIIEFVDELPKTISGKIRRVEIRERDSRENN